MRWKMSHLGMSPVMSDMTVMVMEDVVCIYFYCEWVWMSLDASGVKYEDGYVVQLYLFVGMIMIILLVLLLVLAFDRWTLVMT